MTLSSSLIDRIQNVGIFVLLILDVFALLMYPNRRTAAIVVLVTGVYVLLTQLRELMK